ncbi:MAG: MraY family glycosyltransferase [Alphaproteobacteria bacterium]
MPLKTLLPFDMICMGLSVFGLSIFLTRWMMRMGIHDHPVKRSSHTTPTPRSGGVAIALSFAGGILFLLARQYLSYISLTRLITLGGAIGVTCFFSLKDDIKGLSFLQKFIVQALTGCAIVMVGLSISEIPLPYFGVVPLKALGGVLSVFWIIFFMNVFNFMDGLNGLASGVSIIASLFCTIISFLFMEQSMFYLSLTLFFATLGFFIFNFPRGKIFMGDVGSQFLGLIWSIMLFIPTQELSPISIYTIPLLFFSFIYDVSITVGRRIWNKESFWLAHRTHLFQLLNRLGYSHKQVTCLHLCMAMLQGMGAIWMQYLEPTHQIFMFIPYFVLMVGYHAWIFRALKKRILPYRKKRKKKK